MVKTSVVQRLEICLCLLARESRLAGFPLTAVVLELASRVAGFEMQKGDSQ